MSIMDSLRLRHADAVFVEECKMGSSHAGARRLDAWVLLKTWSPWTAIGYEVKADRSDFLRDRKWPAYLPVCHELYFVCPAKLIAPEELPDDVGLLWTTGGTRLITKRRAVRREPEAEALATLMSYVLMSRTRIVGDMWEAGGRETQADTWRRFLTEKSENLKLGHLVNERIRKELSEAEGRAQRAENDRHRLGHVERRLQELGLDPTVSTWELDRLVGAETLRRIRGLAEQIQTAASEGLALKNRKTTADEVAS